MGSPYENVALYAQIRRRSKASVQADRLFPVIPLMQRKASQGLHSERASITNEGGVFLSSAA